MNRKARVLFITIVPSPYQRELFRALAERDNIDLAVCYMEAASPDSPWPASTLQAYEEILPGFWFWFGGARWHVNWNLPDLHGFDFIVLSSFTSLTGQWLMRTKLRGKRWLFWGERLRPQTNPIKRWVQHRLTEPLQQATAIVGIGSDAERAYRRRFPSQRHFCVPYYCDLSPFLSLARPNLANGATTFLFCGQMIRRKGVDVLLVAFDRLVHKGFDVRLMLVGREADLPTLLDGITSAARERVSYEGFQPPERLPEYFNRADVFVLPSRYDGWGVVVNQALGAGLPIICSDAVGAGSDLVEEGVNGLRFSAGDAAALERCLERTADRELARRWGEASRRKAAEWSPERGALKWVEVFRALDSTA